MTEEEDAAALVGASTLAAWRELCTRWGLSHAERLGLLPESGLECGREDARTRMGVLVEIASRLRSVGEGELRDWLRAPVLLFGLASPLEVMSGSMADLLRMRALVERGFGS